MTITQVSTYSSTTTERPPAAAPTPPPEQTQTFLDKHFTTVAVTILTCLCIVIILGVCCKKDSKRYPEAPNPKTLELATQELTTVGGDTPSADLIDRLTKANSFPAIIYTGRGNPQQVGP